MRTFLTMMAAALAACVIVPGQTAAAAVPSGTERELVATAVVPAGVEDGTAVTVAVPSVAVPAYGAKGELAGEEEVPAGVEDGTAVTAAGTAAADDGLVEIHSYMVRKAQEAPGTDMQQLVALTDIRLLNKKMTSDEMSDYIKATRWQAKMVYFYSRLTGNDRGASGKDGGGDGPKSSNSATVNGDARSSGASAGDGGSSGASGKDGGDGPKSSGASTRSDGPKSSSASTGDDGPKSSGASAVSDGPKISGASAGGAQGVSLMTPLEFVHSLADDLFSRKALEPLVNRKQKEGLLIRRDIMDWAARSATFSEERLEEIVAEYISKTY